MTEILYSPALQTDADVIQALLSQCELPSEDILPYLDNYIVARSEGRVIGVIGLEVYGQFALIRSMAVEPAYRGQGIAKCLNQRIFEQARILGVAEIYLLTQTAAEYASKLGFQKIRREVVPASIQATSEFKDLCPKSSICMMKQI